LVSETRQILDTFFDNTKNDSFMCVNYYVYRFSVFVFIMIRGRLYQARLA
jgi:hypothetical protein